MSLQITGKGPLFAPQVRLVALGAAVLAAVILGLALLGGLGFRFDPFDLAKRRADRAEQQAAVAIDDQVARSLEVEGERASTQRVEVVLRDQAAVYRATTTLSAEAWSAEDASLPLPADRADRLRAHDRELCRISPRLVGCAAAPAADGGDGG